MASADKNYEQPACSVGRPHSTTQIEPVDGELVMRHICHAPPELVFRAWSDPAQVAQWFGPCELHMTVRHMDVRPGGALHMEGACEAGASLRIQGEYREVVEPDWIVYADACFVGEDLICETLATVTFHELGDATDAPRTRVTIHCEPVLGFDAFAQRRWAEGWRASLDRLDALLAGATRAGLEEPEGVCCL